jgi:hypothetical protein
MDPDRARKNEADVAAVLKAPSELAVGVAIALVGAGVLCFVGQARLGFYYWPLLLCPPFFLGTIVGLFSLRRPVRNALATLALIVVAGAIMRSGHLAELAVLTPIALPEILLGAVCGGTIRRRLHAARVYRAMKTDTPSMGQLRIDR